MADPVAARVHAALDRLAGDQPVLGIALSGGGDSTALMHLAHGWGRARLLAATVDHGLRPGSADEARQAGLAAAALDIPHETLCWTRQGGGNLMAAARSARLRLLGDWARRHGLSAVLLGHTLDDQAETLLMRLGRGAGVDGLSAMAPARAALGVTWLRPLLEVGRAELRQWLAARDLRWSDDPSNDNADFQRVRLRQALSTLDLPMQQLAQSAANLAMARDALCEFAILLAQGAQCRAGSLALPLDAFRTAPPEIRRRLLVAGLRFVGGGDYPPRRQPVMHALAVLQGGGRLTLDGVIAETRADRLWLIREPAAAARSQAGMGGDAHWDRRWQIRGLQPGQQVRALGHAPLAGLDWRLAGLTRDEAAASPGIWAGERLIAAPVLQPTCGYGAKPLRGAAEFRALLYMH
ncbi:tRNA(Ile)-lysidine synthase [Paracoccus thiocyanatus]|uniref:tRNA(Ile)-lysidine synthase n=1 Tax=Paracoccus thiocyanatus TaxID=34006 RepID=A0A1N6SBG0_9RHOB|nr:tRNA lysidine(34) synthetase TilS [Paracoccus thiocyanatus]SIQ38377.1 tRNA(Ile)-lysidine synthase [Paracoccus thiocyanatus]